MKPEKNSAGCNSTEVYAAARVYTVLPREKKPFFFSGSFLPVAFFTVFTVVSCSKKRTGKSEAIGR
jgi:hypothetical protein